MPITTRLLVLRGAKISGELTVGINSTILPFCNVEKVWPASDVGKVETQVICLGQRVKVGGVEFEDIRCLEGTQGSHL